MIPYSIFSSNASGEAGVSDQAQAMYKNTYESLTNRITSRGYAPTSLTGAYQGMFIRDSSIQIMAQNAYGDYQTSREVLRYLLSYHQALGAEYAKHIIPDLDDVDYGNTYFSVYSQKGPVLDEYDSQVFTDHALFGMKSPNNGGVVAFQPSTNQLESISIYTNSTGNDVLKGSLRTIVDDETTEIAIKEITITSAGWQKFTFDQPINVTIGKTYYFFVQSNNGIAMFGKADGRPSEIAIEGYNYDTVALGGFAKSAYPAFKLNAQDSEIKTDRSFMSQTNYGTPLFKINTTTHNSAFAFVPRLDNICSFRVYLTGSGEAVFKLTTQPGDENQTIETISKTISSNGWQNIDFGKDIAVTPGQKYYIHIATTSGEIIAHGSVVPDGGVASVNWENNVWTTTGYAIAAEVFSNINVGKNEYAQKLEINGDVIQSVTFKANTSVANGILVGELRHRLTGESLATGQVNIEKTGIQNYTIDFGREIKIDTGEDIYFVLKTKENDSVQWIYNPSLSSESYQYKDNQWREVNYDFGISIFPIYSGQYRVPIVSIGGEHKAVQEIPSYDEYITAVDVILGKNNDKDGYAIATLYSGNGNDAVIVDQTKFDISQLSSHGEIVHLQFGLSLEKINLDHSYYLEIKAPECDENALTWYGSQSLDQFETLSDGEIVEGEAGFIAYKSNIRSLSEHVQIDGNYMLIHAWAQFVNGCQDNEDNQQFIVETYPIIKQFANYYIDNGYINKNINLIKNDSFEHSREGRYWQSYDLITNVFASQALYELSSIAEELNDNEASVKWLETSKTLTKGIHENLVTEIDGVKIYAELYDIEHNMNLVEGMSWVNWAPMAAEWYGMDQSIMQNTYDIYAKYDSQDYDGYLVLDVCYDFNTQKGSNHVIGKGLAWEIMYNRLKGDDEKLDYLVHFILDHSTVGGVYPETYQPNGHFSDIGNQEHASWQHYAMSYAFPQLTKTYSLDRLEKLINELENLDDQLYTSSSYDAMIKVLNQAKDIYLQQESTKTEYDDVYNQLLESQQQLVQKSSLNTEKLEEALNQALQLEEKNYTEESYQTLSKVIQNGQDILDLRESQESIDQATKDILDVMDKLVLKDADYSAVDKAIEKANALNKDLYKDLSAVEKAIEAVERELDITKQSEVDAMAKAIEDAINKLEIKDAVDKPGVGDNNTDTGDQPNSGDKPNTDGDKNPSISIDEHHQSTPSTQETIDKDTNKVNTYDSIMIVPYVILAVCAAGAYVTMKRKKHS